MSVAQIDYRIRPAKHVERQMLCELFRCLAPFGHVASYRYWGFGAIYFADFILIHKMLGLTNMLSMERDEGQERRHTFNRPYKCITLDFRSSQAVLASIEHWDALTVAWLDYTDMLDSTILADVQCFSGHSYAGSILLVTVNCHAVEADEDTSSGATPKGRLERLISRVGADNVPQDVTDKNMAGWGTAAVQARIIRNAIDEALETRNGTRPAGTRYKYQQLVNFRYQDGARMMTVGGLIYLEAQQSIVAQCGFEKLAFYRAGDESYKIETPMLTPHEKRYLDAAFPTVEIEELRATTGIPEDDIRKYTSVYRYFPAFIVGE
jgi:hypothetical protein